MLAPATASLLSALCLACVAGLLVAEWRRHRRARAVFKAAASLAFVGVAVVLGAPASPYGQLVLAALVLSLAGDLWLLSDRPGAFLAGLGAFLLAHVAYAVAFVVLGVWATGAAVAAVLALGFGVLVLRWLRPGLGAGMRGPVMAYVVVILAMCALAIGHATASGRWWVALGAVAFAASDLAVAREKFVRVSFVNKAWGLPAYYVAQLLLAWSVAGAA